MSDEKLEEWPCVLCDRPAAEKHEHLLIDVLHPDAEVSLSEHGYVRSPAALDVAEARAKALEEAARAVEETDVVEARGGMNSYYAQLGDARATLRDAAAAIRSLSQQPTPGSPQDSETKGSGER